MRRLRLALLVLVLAAIVGAVVILEGTRQRGTIAGEEPQAPASRLAADLQGIAGWINGPPLGSLAELQGKVVLLDFWTYTCINCINTLPYLRAWHERYADQGLVIIGVHSPEFAFEKSLENVQQATRDLNVTWLVALDNDKRTWDAFHARAWPTKVLLGPDGAERARVIGEGRYNELEEEIRALLREAGSDLREGPSGMPEPDFNLYRRLTREIYAGYRREFSAPQRYLANPGAARFDEAATFVDPGPPRADGIYFLHGAWTWQEESVRHARTTNEHEDYVALSYSARRVNVVIDVEGEVPFRVLVTLDGKPLPEEYQGADVVRDQGMTYLVVSEPRLYEVVAGPAIERHELRLSPLSDAFVLHTFTFGI